MAQMLLTEPGHRGRHPSRVAVPHDDSRPPRGASQRARPLICAQGSTRVRACWRACVRASSWPTACAARGSCHASLERASGARGAAAATRRRRLASPPRAVACAGGTTPPCPPAASSAGRAARWVAPRRGRPPTGAQARAASASGSGASRGRRRGRRGRTPPAAAAACSR
eukprot:6186501-Pleurochrysis_carterae.AAC.2